MNVVGAQLRLREPMTDCESEGRTLESFRARQLTSFNATDFGIGLERPQTKISV